MKTNAEIVEDAVTGGVIDHALNVYKVSARWRDDLMQEVCVILLTLDNERLNEIVEDGKLSAFTTRIVRNQYRSRESAFYRKYRRYEEKALQETHLHYLADDSE